jgi:hypothetical protein
MAQLGTVLDKPVLNRASRGARNGMSVAAQPKFPLEVAMRIIRFRLFGNSNQADSMITALHELDQVDRVEEVADQMHLRDDTSSLGLPDDEGPDFHCIEAHATNSTAAERVHDLVEITARDINAAVEFVDRF